MTVVVVSSATSLALALSTRTDATGLEPGDLDRFLGSGNDVSAAVVDVGSGAAEIREIVAAFRGRQLRHPIVVIGTSDALPDGWAEQNAPLGFVERPFTVERVLQRLAGLGTLPAVATGTPDATSDEAPVDAESQSGDEPSLQPAPPPEPEQEPAPQPKQHPDPAGPDSAVETAPPARRGLIGRAKQAVTPASRRSPVDDAVAVLLATDELYSVGDVASAIVDLLAEQLGDHVAVMVLDDDGWRVAAGRGLRPIEHRGVLPRRHWLAQQLEKQQSAVIVQGTDLVRQELSGVPLIHCQHWLATTLEQTAAIVVLGCDDCEPYTVEDALVVRSLVGELGPALGSAVETRRLARRLDALRD